MARERLGRGEQERRLRLCVQAERRNLNMPPGRPPGRPPASATHTDDNQAGDEARSYSHRRVAHGGGSSAKNLRAIGAMVGGATIVGARVLLQFLERKKWW